MPIRAAVDSAIAVGNAVSDINYIAHPGLNHRRTFYFIIKYLLKYGKGSTASTPELEEYIVEQINYYGTGTRRRKFNVVSFFAKEWTEAGGKSAGANFMNVYFDVLERSGNEPYLFGIKRAYYDMAREIFVARGLL